MQQLQISPWLWPSASVVPSPSLTLTLILRALAIIPDPSEPSRIISLHLGIFNGICKVSFTIHGYIVRGPELRCASSPGGPIWSTVREWWERLWVIPLSNCFPKSVNSLSHQECLGAPWLTPFSPTLGVIWFFNVSQPDSYEMPGLWQLCGQKGG